MKKQNGTFLAGLAMTVIGVLLFFSIVRVGGFSFSHFGWRNTGPLILVAWCILLAISVATRSRLCQVLLVLCTLALIIVIVLNVRIYVVTTTMFRFVAILVLIFAGAGLMIKEVH